MLEMLFFALQVKVFYAFFYNDEKDGVACVKTEPFKTRFLWIATPFFKRLIKSKWHRAPLIKPNKMLSAYRTIPTPSTMTNSLSYRAFGKVSILFCHTEPLAKYPRIQGVS